jgi:hypothetical protein
MTMISGRTPSGDMLQKRMPCCSRRPFPSVVKCDNIIECD